MGLTVLHAPLHAPSARQRPAVVTREIRKHQATMVGLTEAYGILPALGRMRDYRLVVESGGRDRRRGQKDNPILIRTKMRSLGSGQVLGCDAATPVRIAPERWFTYSAFDVPDVGAVCHVVLHPHASVQDKASGLLRTDNDRAREYGRQMKGLEAMLDFAAAVGWRVVVTGDMNFRDHGADPRSPYDILRAHGLKVVSHGIDCIAFAPALDLKVDEVGVPSSITDHPWLVGRSG
ncbi:hypothetical protein ASC77_18050 [Nocardioides sp. Root1257]|uniref:hypothetical protein n=1 Tax=unclassified Nocardioides TaxID=2615069 RepID=UPI0006F3407B|nr:MULTISPECIES: hypothetical protein [unclassified Nocardioides]KQW47086.1 hypothetical protein ASC77_18050 [Nocardioides sp. Root1257]KRC43831.1 hypothetical protein ASE24_19005 [Nocardioides sp. Root224]